jgi:hypothetical protein
MKGLINEKTGLVDFLLDVNKKRNEIPDIEKIEQIRLADEAMLCAGIVAVGDMNVLGYLMQMHRYDLKLAEKFMNLS